MKIIRLNTATKESVIDKTVKRLLCFAFKAAFNGVSLISRSQTIFSYLINDALLNH